MIGLISVGVLEWNPPVLRHLEGTVLDWFFMYRGTAAPKHPPVTIVSIDESSMMAEGRWPWPRERMAELIRILHDDYQPRTIVTDIIFSEPERNLVSSAQHLPTSSHGDASLAQSIRDAGNVVQGYFYLADSNIAHALSNGSDAGFERIADSTFQEVVDLAGADNQVVSAAAIRSNIPVIATATDAGGFMNFIPDSDGALRFSPLLVRHQGFYLPSLALAALKAFQGDVPLKATVYRDRVDISLGHAMYHTTAQGLVWVNYYGPTATVPTVSASDVLNHVALKDKLRDKLVFIGVSAAGVHDVRATPLDALMPGTEVQAQLALNLLYHDTLQRPDAVYLFEFFILLLIALMYGTMFHRVIEKTHGLMTIFLILSYYVFAYQLFTEGIWLHTVLALGQTLVTFVALFALNYGRSLYQRHQLREAFARFVDPHVVAEAIDHEEDLGLTGDEREISVMFLDVAGFTSFSERLEAKDVVHCINSFFDAATPIVFQHEGCIDRLTGDGLIALFGAPMRDADHAEHACRAALDLQKALEPIRTIFAEREHALHVRVGINSGRMVVGNMGSSRRLQYTFMGDAGNAAARLESLNKQYGSLRMVGERTRELAGDAFVYRELDRVVLVGKQEAMTVYELLGEQHEQAHWQPLIQAYAAALTRYRQGEFSEAADAFERVFREFHDAPAQRMWQRCMELKAREPMADWDGVWKASSK